MKKILAALAFLCVMGMMTPSANALELNGLFGAIYQNTTSPGDGYSTVAPSRGGKASCRNVFGVVSVGDCSVREAMKNGGITQLSFYDINRKNVLGFQTITVKAYGK